MKSVVRFVMMILTVAMIVVLAVLIGINYTIHNPKEEVQETVDLSQVTPLPVETPDASQSEAEIPVPESANTIEARLAVAGDIVCHSGLNTEAYNGESYDYTALMSGASSYLSGADFAVACIETTFPGGTEYTGYPMFKSPDGLARSLKETGIDLLSTANNHSMDGLRNGLIRTLDVLDEEGIQHVGTYRSQAERDENNGITVVDINGISVAFLAFTYGTNGIPVTGFEFAVNLFYQDYLTDLSIIDYDLLRADMAAARALDTDLIAVFMHWGFEYYTSPIPVQYELADFMFSEGADIILGGHSHVPQPIELWEVTDNQGNTRKGVVAYCLGNFISCQNDRYTNLTAIVQIDLVKDLDSGRTYIRDVQYVPQFMVDLEDYGITQAGWRYRLWDLHAAIGSYESGNDLGVINQRLYQGLKDGLDDLHSIMDKEMDAYVRRQAADNGEG